MPKTPTSEWIEPGTDGQPVKMIKFGSESKDIPTNSREEIQEAIAIHKLALVTAIRDSKATWGEGRILSLIQTIKALEAL